MSDEKKITILVADDDHDLREQMIFFLENCGFGVVAAEGEKDALSIIEEQKFDLAVLDLMMENQDSGFILSHKIKKLYPGTPVIIVTGVAKETGLHFDASTREERSWIKADAFIQKDLRFEQLKGEIDRLLKL